MSETEKAPPKPYVPQPDDLDLAFYKACVDAGALCMQHCRACGSWIHPARYYCPQCTSEDFTFDRVSGRASVYSYTVSHVSAEPAWKGRVPYVSIVAELAEGPRVVAAARGIAPEKVALGQKLRIVTENKGVEFAFLWAEPDEG